MDMSNVSTSQTGSSTSTQQSGKANKKQQFEQEKSAAVSAASNNPTLLAKINAVSPHKGAIQELEALMMQATQSNATQPVNQQRTLGIG
jgi:hypothetical protein